VAISSNINIFVLVVVKEKNTEVIKTLKLF